MDIQVQGYRVHVEQAGEGTPALFLHGVPDSADIWSEVVAGVQGRYRCHAPDFMGIHRSEENPRFDYSFEGYADWVEALVTALGIREPVTLVVHDWGGPIGLAWASKYPQRIARVLAVNTVFTPKYRPHFWAMVWSMPLLGEIAMLLMNRSMFRRELQRGSRKLSLARIDKAHRAFSRRSSRFVVLRLYRSVRASSLGSAAERLAALAQRVPVKVLWGEHDPYLPRWVADTFHTRDVKLLPDVGHWVPAEAPEEVTKAMLGML
jgi:pimeloyl-ACP methyl ester carboxylesterase